MFLYKLLSYYSISFLIYKIIKSKIENKNNIKNTLDNKINENINCDNNINDINTKKIYKDYDINNINTKENYQKEHNNINNELILYHKQNIINKNDIDIDLLNLSKKELKNKNNKNILIEKIILNQNTNNIVIENNSSNNYLIYEFNVCSNHKYKIMGNILVNSINNIKIIIKDNLKSYIYNHIDNIDKYKYEHNKVGINTFEFIIDNCEFTFNNEKTIYIYIYFYNNEDITIKDININIIQRNIIKSQDAIIIYKVNDNIYPLFVNVCNILDYIDNENENNNIKNENNNIENTYNSLFFL